MLMFTWYTYYCVKFFEKIIFIWGLNPSIMKIGLIYIPPMPYNTLRLFVALAVALLILQRLYTQVPVRQQDRKTLLISSLGFFFFQLFFTFGLQYTTAGEVCYESAQQG